MSSRPIYTAWKWTLQYARRMLKQISAHVRKKRILLLLGVTLISVTLSITTIHRLWYPSHRDSHHRIHSSQSTKVRPKYRDLDLFHLMNSTNFAHENTTFKRRLPQCIVFGVKKGGTGALAQFLGLHPNIEVAIAEPQFFCNDTMYKRGFEFYRRLMPLTRPDQITLEKSPSYFYMQPSEKRIRRFNKTIKLIITLRHPVKRLVSDYWFERRRLIRGKTSKIELKNNAPATLEESVIDSKTGRVIPWSGLLTVSMYAVHLKRWYRYFKKDQIHIVDGDNLIVNPIEEIEKIETFLGLEHKVTTDMIYFDSSKGFYCFIKPTGRECMGKSKGQPHPVIDPGVHEKLLDFFKPLNEKLFNMVGRRFDWH